MNYCDQLSTQSILPYRVEKDPAISDNQTSGSYPPYDDGLSRNIFIRHANNSMLTGKVRV